jgi:hypothetical protein
VGKRNRRAQQNRDHDHRQRHSELESLNNRREQLVQRHGDYLYRHPGYERCNDFCNTSFRSRHDADFLH